MNTTDKVEEDKLVLCLKQKLFHHLKFFLLQGNHCKDGKLISDYLFFLHNKYNDLTEGIINFIGFNKHINDYLQYKNTNTPYCIYDILDYINDVKLTNINLLNDLIDFLNNNICEPIFLQLEKENIELNNRLDALEKGMIDNNSRLEQLEKEKIKKTKKKMDKTIV